MMTLYDFLRAGHVKRWHIVNTTREQTVAEHSYLVAVIALHMAVNMEKSIVYMESLLCHALFHDAPEIRTGDIPTPAKAHMKHITGEPNLFGQIEEALMPSIPYLGGKPNKEVEQLVKMADLIEAAHWISENGAGRHAEIVAQKCRRKVEDYVHQLVGETGNDWYPIVNEVLMSLGMAPVIKEERISPP